MPEESNGHGRKPSRQESDWPLSLLIKPPLTRISESDLSQASIQCDECEQKQRLMMTPMARDAANDNTIWGDLLCSGCSSIIATLTVDEEGEYDLVRVTTSSDSNHSETLIYCAECDEHEPLVITPMPSEPSTVSGHSVLFVCGRCGSTAAMITVPAEGEYEFVKVRD